MQVSCPASLLSHWDPSCVRVSHCLPPSRGIRPCLPETHPLCYRDNPAFRLSSGPTVVQQALIPHWVFFRSLDEAPVFMELTVGCTSRLALGFFRMLALPDCLLPPLLLRKILLFPLRFGIGLTSSRRYSLNTIPWPARTAEEFFIRRHMQSLLILSSHLKAKSTENQHRSGHITHDWTCFLIDNKIAYISNIYLNFVFI